MVKVIKGSYDLDDLFNLLVGEVAFQLKNCVFFILLANEEILLKRGNTNVAAQLSAKLVEKKDGLQGVKAYVFDGDVLVCNSFEVAVVIHCKFAVRGAVNVGFNAEIRAVARRNEGGVSIFAFNARQTSVGDKSRVALVYLYSIDTEIRNS